MARAHSRWDDSLIWETGNEIGETHRAQVAPLITFPSFGEQSWAWISKVTFVPSVPFEMTSLQIHFKQDETHRDGFTHINLCRCKSFSSFETSYDTTLTRSALSAALNFPSHITCRPCNLLSAEVNWMIFCQELPRPHPNTDQSAGARWSIKRHWNKLVAGLG